MDGHQSTSGWKYGISAYRPGETVFCQGDLAADAYIVQSGQIEIRMKGPGGDVVLGRVGEGELFGEMALVDDSPRMASAVCIEPTVLRIVPCDVFEAKLRGADPFVRALVRVLVRNARVNAAHR